MEEILLKIKGISKHFGGVYAVNGISLDITSGKIWGLVGPNGSGKSTLFNTVLGIHQADEGNIYFKDRCITNLVPHQIFDLGLVYAFQVPRLFQTLNVLDNMLVAGREHKGDKLLFSLFFRKSWQKKEIELAEKAMEILRLLKLDHLALSPAGELSGGQSKLLELGKGLMASPTLLLLDEPAAGVNPNLGRSMFERIEDLCQTGLSFFIIEHRLELLFDFAHWVYVMDKGKIVLEGKPPEVAEDPSFYHVYLGDE
ncbi:MAG: ABC transporter ATP-binding protein [Deltaproteobacteria bacterium]|nr:ABC transporter ATP-binding protein [Deltaproteobacteria bacterium]RLB24506.1 MAG: ABC transporter ATP-binding protein [Deltaproteobacteria bacterium]